jgi:hypothetical protein
LPASATWPVGGAAGTHADKQHAAQLKEEFLRALMAGTLAGALAPLARESEEAFIGAHVPEPGPPADRVLLSRRSAADPPARGA